jgi:phenylpropionate dioxygenase-like ring-hydroxylating dioxygenase large terminal subunit
MTAETTYLRNAWYMAGWNTDFPAGKPTAALILDQPLVFYRQRDGRIVALEDRCPHRLAPLSMGQVEGDDLRCLYHGVKFNAAGECLEVPGSTTRPKALCARAWPVVERQSAVFVWMGDAAKADEASLPPFIGYEDPDWQMLPGHMDYDIWYELIQDNLLDLSHLAWVHRNSFGGGNEETNRAWAEGALTISSLPNGVRVERWMPNARTRPALEAELGLHNDTLTTFDYLLPGYFLLTTCNFPVGAAARAGGKRPSEEPVFRTWTSQAVTPRSRRKTTYFFCFGPWSKQPGAEQMKKVYRDLAEMVFNEDRDILTAQQRIIDADPSRRMALFDVDRAPVMYRRLVEKLLAAEATQG